jgi:hypothetical protein
MSVALQQARESVARDERETAHSHPVYPARPREGANLEQLRFEIMERFRKTLAYLGR